MSNSILDSGNRTEFATGAVRDIQEGKGRCDLLPLDIVQLLIPMEKDDHDIFDYIYVFMKSGDENYLIKAANAFISQFYPDKYTAIIELSKHFEDGSKKYGDYNWQKGIPLSRYVDSALRHFLKYLRGDKDEPHDRACLWNLVCGAWTCKHKEELNGYLISEITHSLV